MKVKVIKPCFIGGSRRKVGQILEWGGTKVPSCFEVIESPVEEPRKARASRKLVEAPEMLSPELEEGKEE